MPYPCLNYVIKQTIGLECGDDFGVGLKKGQQNIKPSLSVVKTVARDMCFVSADIVVIRRPDNL
jgi:hypothetical protein